MSTPVRTGPGSSASVAGEKGPTTHARNGGAVISSLNPTPLPLLTASFSISVAPITGSDDKIDDDEEEEEDEEMEEEMEEEGEDDDKK